MFFTTHYYTTNEEMTQYKISLIEVEISKKTGFFLVYFIKKRYNSVIAAVHTERA